MIHRSTWHSEAGRIGINDQPTRGFERRIRGETTTHHYGAASAHGRRRKFCLGWGAGDLRKSIERVRASTGLPDPAKAGNEHPVAGVVWSPSPGIAGNPGIAAAGIESPAAILKGTPVGADEIGLPDVAVAIHIHKAAVIIQVADAVAVRA